jgi:5-methylcytosine-specific restriction endonuclease McrA
MLREARNCGFLRQGGLFRRRHAFVVGTREAGALRPGAHARAARAQRHEPIPLFEAAGRRWWWYRDRFYWEDEGYGPLDVVALVADRERRRRRTLDRAHAALHQERASASRRDPLPRELRLAVWRRDRGRCRECGNGFDLQYDHVIPLALGGATSVGNLQLLCGDCNRAKGGSL